LKRNNFQSLKILAYAYDEKEKILEVRLSNGVNFIYYQVDAEAFRGFGAATSKEKYFYDHIRFAGYSYATIA
jgi:hypothetical protein